MALDPVTELDALVDALDADGVAYALCGGLALAVHGHVRATRDIDLLLPASEIDRALAAAKRVGFDVPARPMTFGVRSGAPREIRRVSKLDPTSGALLALDLIIVNDALDAVWRGREVVHAGARRLTVVSRDGLAIMKRIAGRKQDLADLARLEGTDDDDEA